MRRVCVFCGSSPGAAAEYAEAARGLGRLLAGQGLGLVYGGARIGLMNEVASGVLERGGNVIGVITRQLNERDVGHQALSDLRVVESMHERKATMARLADGFLALPGGLGTLDELFEILAWAQLGLHRKPCGILNVRGYYDGLRSFLGHAVAEGFVTADQLENLIVDSEPDALVARLVSRILPDPAPS